MEEIVTKNKTLSWDGWTVVFRIPSVSKTNSKNIIKINNKWFVEERFEVSENGWDIPKKFLESNG